MRIVFVRIEADGLRKILRSFVRVFMGPSICSNAKVEGGLSQ